jgi:pimeloyl-ACP methyl ester carboxylesterase
VARLNQAAHEVACHVPDYGELDSLGAMADHVLAALLNRPDATGLLAAIRCPTLRLCGREDAWSPPSRHEFMRDRTAGARLLVLEHCGHRCTMEQPAAVSAALADWLAFAPTHQD